MKKLILSFSIVSMLFCNVAKADFGYCVIDADKKLNRCMQNNANNNNCIINYYSDMKTCGLEPEGAYEATQKKCIELKIDCNSTILESNSISNNLSQIPFDNSNPIELTYKEKVFINKLMNPGTAVINYDEMKSKKHRAVGFTIAAVLLSGVASSLLSVGIINDSLPLKITGSIGYAATLGFTIGGIANGVSYRKQIDETILNYYR